MENQDLKRCRGVKYPGDKTRVLTDPHMESPENFSNNSSQADGLQPVCKNCRRSYMTARRNSPKEPPPEFMTCRDCNKLKHNSEMKNDPGMKNGKANTCSKCASSKVLDWHRANPDKVQANAKRWCERNPGKVRANSQRWYKNNSVKAIGNAQQWRKSNPEKSRAIKQRRNDRLHAQPNENVSKERLLEIHGSDCYLCGKPVPENIGDWDLEHVIPLSRGKVGTTYANCRVAHASCNRSKHSKTYFEYEIERSTHYVTLDNLYLFNEVYEWHVQTFWAELRKTQGIISGPPMLKNV